MVYPSSGARPICFPGRHRLPASLPTSLLASDLPPFSNRSLRTFVHMWASVLLKEIEARGMPTAMGLRGQLNAWVREVESHSSRSGVSLCSERDIDHSNWGVPLGYALQSRWQRTWEIQAPANDVLLASPSPIAECRGLLDWLATQPRFRVRKSDVVIAARIVHSGWSSSAEGKDDTLFLPSENTQTRPDRPSQSKITPGDARTFAMCMYLAIAESLVCLPLRNHLPNITKSHAGNVSTTPSNPATRVHELLHLEPVLVWDLRRQVTTVHGRASSPSTSTLNLPSPDIVGRIRRSMGHLELLVPAWVESTSEKEAANETGRPEGYHRPVFSLQHRSKNNLPALVSHLQRQARATVLEGLDAEAWHLHMGAFDPFGFERAMSDEVLGHLPPNPLKRTSTPKSKSKRKRDRQGGHDACLSSAFLEVPRSPCMQPKRLCRESTLYVQVPEVPTPIAPPQPLLTRPSPRA